MDPPLKAGSDRCPFRLVGARSGDSTNTCGGILDSSAHQGYSVCDGHAAEGEEAFLAETGRLKGRPRGRRGRE